MLRIRHDNPARTSSPLWHGHSQTPETQQLDGFGSNFTLLDQAWIEYALDLNAPGKPQNLITSENGGICNAGWPKLMHVTMGGNVVKLDKVDTLKKLGYVHTLDFYAGPPSIKDVNYWTHPELVFKWVNVGWKDNQTYWCNPVSGEVLNFAPVDVFWPNVSQIPVTIPLDKLEAFPEIPDAGLTVTLSYALHVRGEPYGQIVDTLMPGESLPITDYAARGSDVWGHIAASVGGNIGNRWICLEQSTGAFQSFYTDWHMETAAPPIAPYIAFAS